MTKEKQTIDTGNFLQLYDKPFEEMALNELTAEVAVHKWHAAKVVRNIDALNRKKWWQENNMPIPSTEELRQQYEDGLMTKKQWQTANGRRAMNIRRRMNLNDQIAYGELIKVQEYAVVALLEELIAEAKSEKVRPGRPRKQTTGYDPRKRRSKYNNRTWTARQEQSDLPQLRNVRRKYVATTNATDRTHRRASKTQSVINWDVKTFRSVARDRGFYTDVAVAAYIADIFGITVYGANHLLMSGRFTWGQCIVLGAMFEMTPKEFCDTFLNGYFREVTDGVFKAHVDDYEAFLGKAYSPRQVQEEDTNESDDN